MFKKSKIFFTLLHTTVGMLNQPTIGDCIAFLSNFYTICILLSSSNKKLYMLGWGNIPGGFGLIF